MGSDLAQSASTPMATMAPSAKACRVIRPKTYTHNTPRPPVRAERAISCVLRGSVWLADEKVRLAGGDKRGLITLLFVARPPQNLSDSFEAFTFTTVDYQYSHVFHDIAHSGWRSRGAPRLKNSSHRITCDAFAGECRHVWE